MQNKVLVLGVGNVLLKDDGLGPLVVRELQNEYQIPNVTFLDGGTLGLDLLAYLEDYTHLLVIDALDFKEEPGKLFCWHGKNLNNISEQVSFHQVGLKELFYAAQLLDIALDITVMGIQVEDLSWGMGFSEKVQHAIPLLKELILKQLID